MQRLTNVILAEYLNFSTSFGKRFFLRHAGAAHSLGNAGNAIDGLTRFRAGFHPVAFNSLKLVGFILFGDSTWVPTLRYYCGSLDN